MTGGDSYEADANLASKHLGLELRARDPKRPFASAVATRYFQRMLIGELARQAGVNLESVRFYEREGLLPCPPRTTSGYRVYDKHHLETIRFIKRSQALGFTLSEIRQLLELHEQLASGKPVKTASQDLKLLELTRERLHSIEEKIQTLDSMRRQLAKFLRLYQSQKKLVCPAAK